MAIIFYAIGFTVSLTEASINMCQFCGEEEEDGIQFLSCCPCCKALCTKLMRLLGKQESFGVSSTSTSVKT
jgi:hypothetical protein